MNGTRGERLFDPEFVSLNNADPISIGSITTAENNNRLGAFINYNASYKNFLNFSLAGRMDGSSRLVDPTNWDPAKPYYFYWSAGSSLILSDILKLPKEISYLKYRINYATTGRDPRTPYVTSNRFAQSTFTGGGFPLSLHRVTLNCALNSANNLRLVWKLNSLREDWAWI